MRTGDAGADAPRRTDGGADGRADAKLAPAADAGRVDATSPGDGSLCILPAPGSWALTSAGLTTTCATDTDCTAVYLGPNACPATFPGLDGGGGCPNTAISTVSYGATYFPELRAIIASCTAAFDLCCPGCTSPTDCAEVAVGCDAGTCVVTKPE